jgi:hypothetical protein
VIGRAGRWSVRGAACARHLPALVDLVDRGERGPDTDAALDHLGGCGRCRDEVTELALTVAALRRVSTAYRAIPAPVIARPAVPERRRPWAWRAQLGGLITSAGIAALLVAPQIGLGPSGASFTVDAPGRPPAPAWRSAEQRIAASPDTAPWAAASDSVIPRYPDGRLRPWKEVPSNDADARGLDPK